MKTTMIHILAIAALLLFAIPIQAQTESDTTQLWRIELTNENEYIGTIVSQNDTTIVFKSQELGIININRKNIALMEEISATRMKEGEYWFDNPQATRYFWAPTGYGLRKGEGYYQNVWILFNQFSFGITDHTSIGFGTVPLFLLGGGPTPVWLTPKVSIPMAEKLHLGAGALVGTVLGEDTGGAFGIAYGTLTLGTRDNNFNLGLGYGFSDGGWAKAPTITISGMARVSRRGYFLTENYLISTGDEFFALVSIGGRRVGKKLSLDFGGVLPLSKDIGAFIAIPWLGIVVPFNLSK